jgi:hypothetical protein
MSTKPQNSEEFATPLFLIQRHRQMRNLILDYAIAAALLGLNPIRGTLTLTLLVAGLLIWKMICDIGSSWGYAKGQDALAIAGKLFGIVGAFALAFMAWVTVFCLGLLAPLLSGFGISAALFTLTWTLGQVINQFYASGR